MFSTTARAARVRFGRGGRLLVLLLLSATALSTGCLGSLGASTVRMSRTDYNVAAQQTGAQELLLNLVRLRYRDTPYFLQIASLSTNMRATAGIGGEGSFLTPGGDAGKLTGTLLIEESPTVTYTPIVGDRFVNEMLEPVEPEILLLLSHAGWSIDRFFRLLVQELNGIPNAPTASGPTPANEPVFRDFLRVTELLRGLQSRRQVSLMVGRIDDAPEGVLLRFTPEALESAEYSELVELLALEDGRDLFALETGIGERAPDRINIVLRSVMSAMFYASHGITVPEEDRAEGRVTTTRTAEGEPFDWGELSGSLLRVESGWPKGPTYASVRYRGSTFYIDDRDIESKSTFSMLNLVLALKSGDIPTGGPILTLPVSQ